MATQSGVLHVKNVHCPVGKRSCGPKTSFRQRSHASENLEYMPALPGGHPKIENTCLLCLNYIWNLHTCFLQA